MLPLFLPLGTVVSFRPCSQIASKMLTEVPLHAEARRHSYGMAYCKYANAKVEYF